MCKKISVQLGKEKKNLLNETSELFLQLKEKKSQQMKDWSYSFTAVWRPLVSTCWGTRRWTMNHQPSTINALKFICDKLIQHIWTQTSGQNRSEQSLTTWVSFTCWGRSWWISEKTGINRESVVRCLKRHKFTCLCCSTWVKNKARRWQL